jgi:iron complex outermembrane receptor protein
MKVTKRLFTSVCPAAILAFPVVLSLTPALAQSTGTESVETITVTGKRMSLNGLMNAAPVAKEKSVVTSEFLETQTAGQTVFQSLNFMPGINFTNNDPYGTSGGNIRMHGQDGNHISLTLDGMPLNDTGNYAIYTNQMLDAEVIDRVSALQGATDVDSPTAAATGGVIAITSDKPHDEFGAMGNFGFGENAMQRYFVRLDTGKFGPFGTVAFGSFSYQDYDKFKGSGKLHKIQGNLKIYQDVGDLGWFSLSGHWNVNRNNAYYSPNYVQDASLLTASQLSGSTDLIKDANGAYVATSRANGTSYNTTGWDRDYADTCTYNSSSGSTPGTPTAGVADSTMTTCANWYKLRLNPSDTGNIRFHSLWHLMPKLTLTADANFQYVLATGGTMAASLSETDSKLKGTSTGTGTTTTAFGCISGVGCDLNGDGDVKDSVLVMSPSVTNTRRYGFSSSLIYQLTEDQTLQAAYTLDWGLHRQTGQNGLINGLNGFYNPFGPVADDGNNLVKSADGTPIRYRDRKSYAVMNQIAFDWEGNWLDSMVQTTVGYRIPFFERRLNQYCYEALGSSTAYCTSATPTAVDTTMNTVTINGTKYVPGGKAVKRYSRSLPHLGLTLKPFGNEHQFFSTYTQEIAAPRTDNLYTSAHIDATSTTSPWTAFAATKPETSTTYQIGYRYLGEDIQASLVWWNSQVRNRIVSTYDTVTATYFDHNIPGINFSGFDLESNYKVTDDLTLYANAGYDHARITTNITVGGGAASTLNKQLSETPKWELNGRATYNITNWFNIGASVHYVSRRNMTEDNNVFVPDYYTVNLDSRVKLDDLGVPGSSIKLNVDNLFDKHYFGSIGSYTCFSAMTGCTSVPYANIGSPRTISVTLSAVY